MGKSSRKMMKASFALAALAFGLVTEGKLLEEETYPWSPSLTTSLAPLLAVVFLVVGLALGAMFFLHEITAGPSTKNLPKEIGLAAAASFALGVGGLFLMLAVGIYV